VHRPATGRTNPDRIAKIVLTTAEFPPPLEGESRLGICLSGGGFRASFFHIGVLGRLAQRGILRHVQVISTVSGGSIIGALYYLHVKKLLESKPDAEIVDQDYLDLVHVIEREFSAGVKKNLVLRTFLDPVKTIKMALPSYSRSDRVGELYDQLFYRPVVGCKGPVLMRELTIAPPGCTPTDDVPTMNVGRRAKVPVLQINATSLNTGRCWRFGATRMGEPPATDPISAEIDKRTRLRRAPGYHDLPPRLRDIPLGVAVAASAGVPGLLPPLPVTGLYGDEAEVQLVDGGVFDNLGLTTLFDCDCTAVIVSDASAQMAFDRSPSDLEFLVLARTNEILMDRVRELILGELLRSRPIPVALVHLRKGLDAEAIAGPLHPDKGPNIRERASSCQPADFGVDPRVQDALSRVRTDLDAFTDVEAQSLMLDGYLVTGHVASEVPALATLSRPITGAPPFAFEAVAPWVKSPTPEFLRQLHVAQQPWFKYFRLVPRARALAIAILVSSLLLPLVLAWPVLAVGLSTRLTVWTFLGLLALPVLVVTSSILAAQSRAAHDNLKPMVFVRTFTLQTVVGALGSLLIQLHLRSINRWFLEHGDPRWLKPPATKDPGAS